MPQFKFKAKKTTGEMYEGVHESKDKFALYKELKDQGDIVITADEVRKKTLNVNLTFLQSVKTHEKIMFARNLGAMIEAGLSMSRALVVMQKQSKNQKLNSVIDSILKDIDSGKTFSESMKAHPKIFSSLFISMVHAGEESGSLAQSLKVVSKQMEQNYKLQKKVRGALMYPSIVLSAMVIIGILMMIFVVPTLTATFRELKVDLPLSTKMVILVSDFLRDHSIVALIGFIVIATALYFAAKTAKGKKFFNFFFLHVPVIGNLVKEVNSARTARTLSSLLSAGVDVVESIRITGEVVQNIYYKEVLAKTEKVIQQGSPISQSFTEATHLYPLFVGEMISVGEETGRLSEMLMGVASFYEEDVEQRTKDMSTIIEPFLMVIIGIGVGFFAIAMISPTYSLMGNI